MIPAYFYLQMTVFTFIKTIGIPVNDQLSIIN
jgi:hypothetical protein